MSDLKQSLFNEIWINEVYQHEINQYLVVGKERILFATKLKVSFYGQRIGEEDS